MANALDMQPMTIVTSRQISTASTALFEAFADPERLKLWWGPDGFTNTIHTFDFRSGGTWRFTMHAPDGSNFENTCTFGEIVPGSRIVFVHHLPMHVFTMTMDFIPSGDGSLLQWTMVFAPNETNASVRPFIEAANEQNFNRLEDNLKIHGALS